MIFEHVFKSLVENTNDVIMVMDASPLEEGGPFIVYVNPAFERLLGYSNEDVVGKNPKVLQGPDTDNQTRENIRAAMGSRERIRTQILNYTRSGQPLWMDINIVPIFNDQGELAYFAAIERDLTEHKMLQSRLEILASTDALTGLPNRQAIMGKAKNEFSRAKRYSRPLSIVMIDVDHFKSINDQHGHAAGDHVLTNVGHILGDSLRDSDVLARIGGEEFVLLLPDTPQANAEFVAERMRAQLANSTIRFEEIELKITASFGVAAISDADENLEQMLSRADHAMYEAKHSGRNKVKTAA
jgi:diguanylate cyclase (GGDEF)-like protein/PAS domain S-box-containing protein